MNIPQIESNFRELDDILCRGYAPNGHCLKTK